MAGTSAGRGSGTARRRRVRAAVVASLLLPGLILVWFVAGLVGALLPSAGAAPGDDVEIRLVGTAIHYDFLLPATAETRAAFGFAAEVPVEAPDVAWILAGWGAREFYTATGTYADLAAGPVARAVTGDASVLRVEVWGPFDGADSLRLRLGSAQYTRLLAAIVATADGPALDGAGFSRTDAFYPARGRFDVLRTCNVWVGRMLRAAGLRFGVWTPTPQAVRLSATIYLNRSATSVPAPLFVR